MDRSLVAPICTNCNGATSISPINRSSSLTNQYNTRDDDLTIWQEDYWQQMLADFKQLKLHDISWLEPIKDAISQAECILHQILYPGMDTSNNVAGHKICEDPDMLNGAINKLSHVTYCSEKLLEEIGEQESGTFVRLLNGSDQLENVLTKLKTKASIMKKLNAKDVRLDMLLYNFKDVTRDRRLLHSHSFQEVIRKMAESIYNCKSSISLLCTETNQSTMVELDTSILQKGFRQHRYYIHIINKLVHLARQLNVDLAAIKISRDCIFNNEFSDHLIAIMEMEKEGDIILRTFKNHNHDQYRNIRLKAFLKDTRVLQQAYNHWKELRRENSAIDSFPKGRSGCDTSWLEFDPKDEFGPNDISWLELHPKDALDVVLQWDPFNSLSCVGHAAVSVHIFSLADSTGASTINTLQSYAKTILQVASSSLNDLFHCLINANAAFHNAEVIHAYASAQHPSRWFCASSGTTLSSGERGSSYASSFSSSHSANLSSHPISIPSPKRPQQRPICEIESTYGKEKTSDGRIFHLFCDAISNLKQLANMLVHKKCGHVLSEAFREALQTAMGQKLALLGFHQEVNERLEKLWWMMGSSSALRERRRDWERTFRAVVYALLPWPKCLCDEIFPDGTEELKEVCFEYAKNCLMQLLKFADSASCANSSWIQRIFHQLHVHEVLRELSANVSTLFQGFESIQLSFSREETLVFMRLQKAILEALADFNHQLKDDNSCINQNEVDVHPLTQNTMSYVKELSCHKMTINWILNGEVSFPSKKRSFLSDQTSGSSEIRIDAIDCREYMLLLLSSLESKLVQKCEVLKACTAKQVFWINNLDYMIEETVDPQLKIILGEQWVQEQNNKIEGYLIDYEESVRTEVQSFLNASKGIVRKRLKSFKSSIEEMCKVQASWKVPNPIWRDALRDAALDAVVAVYNSFKDEVSLGNSVPVPVLFSEEDLEDLQCILLDLFEG